MTLEKIVIVASVCYSQSLNFRIDLKSTNFIESRPILADKKAYLTEVGLLFMSFVIEYSMMMR